METVPPASANFLPSPSAFRPALGETAEQDGGLAAGKGTLRGPRHRQRAGISGSASPARPGLRPTSGTGHLRCHAFGHHPEDWAGPGCPEPAIAG